MLCISFIFKPAYPLGRVAGGNIPRRTWNISRSTAISDSSSDSTPRWDQAMSEMQSLHLGLGRPLGRFAVGLASKACLASLLYGVLDTWPNKRSCDILIRTSGSTFSALQISQLRTLSRSVTPGT